MQFKWSNGTNSVTAVPAKVAESSFDDVIVFVLVFVSALLLIFIGCSAYKIKLWFRGQHAGVGSSSDESGQTYADDPPPYPGKLSRTNINYLPSYNSALQLSTLSGGILETTNIPESPRTNQSTPTLTVPPVTDGGTRLVIPGAEEPRSTTPASQDSRRLRSITEETTTVLPVIEISDVSSEPRSPTVFTL
ncbi:uncharacterized protein LOC111101894 [Crassostrea virginica]|uniref:Uncharacterized protein LOC111107551 n=1 Tax=Crassostrea virginica TaxID=6565 RepID=A0A8B8B562_CRAVI|nr:uncharacterized protein LOC111107551 [Crassostrea virginica]XP_022298627.1 uncharacterized protein LOC111107551 [Crassostrea virginica]XP_022298714.1 uncharacterized protein LOC111107551 [Crassostrea virginica]